MYLAKERFIFLQPSEYFYLVLQWRHPVSLKTVCKWVWLFMLIFYVVFCVSKTMGFSDFPAMISTNLIKIRRLEWLGRVIRMNETKSLKKIFEEKLEGRRGRGRPRLRWINDVEDDLRKLGVK